MAIKPLLRDLSIVFLFLSTAIEAFYDHHHEPAVPPPHDHDHHHHNHNHNHQVHHHRHPGNNVKILLPQILSQLGFLDLATAASSLSSSSTADWPAVPSTVFAPSDDSVRSSCRGAAGIAFSSCSPADLLHEHVVPGLFSADRLRNLPIGAKIETLSPGHCVAVTRKQDDENQTAPPRIFVGETEIAQPDLFNDGVIIVHGLKGFISPPSPFSCDHPYDGDDQDSTNQQSLHFSLNPNYAAATAIMRLMLKDSILRLRATGFGVLALAMKIKYPELVRLDSLTVFAINDASIFAGLHSYVGNIRFHIVPNAYLTMADLEKLPLGTVMPTLAEGQSLVVTAGGFGGLSPAPMRINYVRIRVPEVMRNFKIVIHALFLPFPHIRSVVGDEKTRLVQGACHPEFGGRVCAADRDPDHVPVPPEKPAASKGEEDHHGL